MKKFLFILIILILLGGAAFFLGWAHLNVPPGSYGVIHSKTHGLESNIIRAGEFRWLWYKLLPTNVEISAYTIKPVNRSIRSSGTLSSGDVYTALAGVEADFSWEISGELEFSVNPDFLPDIIESEHISDDSGLRSAEEKLAGRIENLVLRRLKFYADEDGEKMDSLILAGSLPELDDEIQALFPEIENISCTIKAVRYPDYTLYQSLKALYRDYLTRQNAALNPDIAREAENRIDARLRLDELAQYGELLTKYPVLLQYLALEKGLGPAGFVEIPPPER